MSYLSSNLICCAFRQQTIYKSSEIPFRSPARFYVSFLLAFVSPKFTLFISAFTAAHLGTKKESNLNYVRRLPIGFKCSFFSFFFFFGSVQNGSNNQCIRVYFCFHSSLFWRQNAKLDTLFILTENDMGLNYQCQLPVA